MASQKAKKERKKEKNQVFWMVHAFNYNKNDTKEKTGIIKVHHRRK